MEFKEIWPAHGRTVGPGRSRWVPERAARAGTARNWCACPGAGEWGRTELRAQREPLAVTAGGGRCTRQVSARGFRRPGGLGLGEWVRGRCGTGGPLPKGDSAASGRHGEGARS